jgi:hypothetical protein
VGEREEASHHVGLALQPIGNDRELAMRLESPEPGHNVGPSLNATKPAPSSEALEYVQFGVVQRVAEDLSIPINAHDSPARALKTLKQSQAAVA